LNLFEFIFLFKLTETEKKHVRDGPRNINKQLISRPTFFDWGDRRCGKSEKPRYNGKELPEIGSQSLNRSFSSTEEAQHLSISSVVRTPSHRLVPPPPLKFSILKKYSAMPPPRVFNSEVVTAINGDKSAILSPKSLFSSSTEKISKNYHILVANTQNHRYYARLQKSIDFV
jgi:hypothetical protein